MKFQHFMRTGTTIILFYIIFTFVFVNCTGTSKKPRKPVTSIQLSPSRTNLRIGDKLSFNLSTKVTAGELSKVEVFLDGKSVFSGDKSEATFSLDTKKFNVGTHNLKVIATRQDGTSGENYMDFLLLSDIIPKNLIYRVVKTYPHNKTYFTEGLEIRNGYLYEGTGQEGSSSIYKLKLSEWKIVKELKLENKYFGEGITILNNKLYQLTYKTQIGFIRDLNSFELIKTWNYKNAQGWGLTNDGHSLIMSDGTDYLYFLNPESLNVIKKLQVCNYNGTVNSINELEYINGEIWANLWTSDTIIKIDPETGKVNAIIDCKGLLGSSISKLNSEVDVLNGIAYDNDSHKIYITGKFWPKFFEITVEESSK